MATSRDTADPPHCYSTQSPSEDPSSGYRFSSVDLHIDLSARDLDDLLRTVLAGPDPVLRQIVLGRAPEHITGEGELATKLAAIMVAHRMAKEVEAEAA